MPKDNIASINIRYALPKGVYEQAIRDAVNRLMKLKGVTNLNVELRRDRT